jgi:hypothetical protein
LQLRLRQLAQKTRFGGFFIFCLPTTARENRNIALNLPAKIHYTPTSSLKSGKLCVTLRPQAGALCAFPLSGRQYL